MTWLQRIRQRLAEPVDAASEFVVDAAVRTAVGRVREGNEDSVLFVRPRQQDLQVTRGVLAVVADGMGGANSGEIASRLACQTISEVYFATAGSPRESLHEAFIVANKRIFAASEESAETRGMGTTAAAVAVIGNTAWLAHVGDSRIYLLRESAIYQMSQDDSLVAQMVRDGHITAEQARSHEDRNILLRALGTKPEVEPGSPPHSIECRAADRFLLCSDGLHDLVSDEEMREAVCSLRTNLAVERLVEMANSRGGPDNISVILVSVDSRRDSQVSVVETREVEVG
jgi:PPM family protein phosphatase